MARSLASRTVYLLAVRVGCGVTDDTECRLRPVPIVMLVSESHNGKDTILQYSLLVMSQEAGDAEVSAEAMA